MAEFNSPLGNKKFGGQQMRQFDIPDESGYSNESIQQLQQQMDQDTSEIEREIRTAKEAKRTGKERLNEGAKKRIEMLIGMTRTTKSVDIEGNEFVFQSLKSKEFRDAVMAAAAFDGSIQSPFEIRRQFLTRSLTHVAGVDIEQFLGSVEFDAKLAFIDQLDEALLNRLYDEYLSLAQEAKDKFSIKTNEDASQVIEDLKK